MNAIPMVSVVMITYNHEKYIEEAIEGVLMQTITFPIELIIANDNSPDNTDDIVKNILKNHSKSFIIRYINQKENKGMIANFIDALSQCSGKYIAFCEGDDYWVDHLKLQRQVNFLEENLEYGLVATDFSILHQGNGKMEESLFKNDPVRFPIYTDFKEFLLAAGYMAPCTWVLRKEFLPSFKKTYIDGSFAWLLDIYAKSKVYVLLETTAVYRLLTESASHTKSKSKMYLRAIGILEIQLDYINKYKLSESFKLKVLKRHYRLALPLLILLGQRDEIKYARIYIPKNERNFRDKVLFVISRISLSKELLRFVFFLKDKIKI